MINSSEIYTASEATATAVGALAEGRMIVVVDDADRENEADLVMGARFVTPEAMAFMVQHTTGIICVPMPGDRIDALLLPQMVNQNTEAHATAFTVSVDHVSTSTGVSSSDRARTIRALADPLTSPDDLRRPGHVFPLRYREGGVLGRAGHTEAAVDLLRLAAVDDTAVISELVGESGEMARAEEVELFAARHSLPIISIAELQRHRRNTERLVHQSGYARIPTKYGTFRATCFQSSIDGTEHLALVMGDVNVDPTVPQGHQGLLVGVHSECLTGDIFRSIGCDCGQQLEKSMAAVAEEGRGVVIYLRGRDSERLGLGPRIQECAMRNGRANSLDLGHGHGPTSTENSVTGAQILDALGIQTVRLVTNDPFIADSLSSYGVDVVERVDSCAS